MMKTLILLGFASIAAAQGAGANDARWQGFLGCWRPLDAASEPVMGPILCVVPTTTSSAVDLVTLVAEKEVSRERFDASGDRRPVVADGCEGWTSARWSDDGRRAYLRSEVACAGGVQRTSTGVLAVSRHGDLLDIRSVSAGGGTGVRVNRFRDAIVPPTFPVEIVDALSGRQSGMNAARIASSANVTQASVVEASRFLDTPALEALIVERDQLFRLDAKALVSFADAGVPGSVTDLMIALSNPRVFKLDRRTGAPSIVGDSTSRYANARRRCSNLDLAYDPWVFTPYWGYGLHEPGCGSYGYGRYGYGSRYGYSGYDHWYWNQPTYVVVTRAPEPKGKLVNGSGYTRTDGSSTTTATSSSSGSSSSGSSGRSDGAARTAKPRPK